MTNDAGHAAGCLRCGYDLRGLTDDMACPECGLGVGRSVRGDREVARGRPGWVARLRLGVWLLLAVQLGVLATVPTLMLVDALQVRMPQWVAAAVVYSGLTLHAAALVLLTGREDPFERRPAGNWVRLAVRASASNDAWLAVCGVAMGRAAAAGWPRETWEYGMIAGVGLFAVVWALTLWHLRTLAKRVLDRSLAEHCLIVGIGLPVAVAVPFATAALRVNVNRGNFGLYAAVAEMVALALFVLWSVLLMAWFAIAFGRAAKAARQSWVAADAAVPPPAV